MKENLDIVEEKMFRSIHSQTFLRESEAQTDPYSPNVIGEIDPEILLLSSLTFQKGLPPSKYDIYVIALLRESLREEKALEAIKDKICPDEYTRRQVEIMTRFENQVMSIREQEISDLQETRLNVIKEIMNRKSEKTKEYHEKIRAKRITNYEDAYRKTVLKLKKDFSRNMRKISRENGAPNVYASLGKLVRKKQHKELLDNVEKEKNIFLTTVDGLNVLKHIVRKDFYDLCNVKIKPYSISKRVIKEANKIKEIHEYFHNIVTSKNPQLTDTELISVEDHQDKTGLEIEEERQIDMAKFNRGVFQLQSLIRGRAKNIEMTFGRMRNQDLIDELRSTHALMEDEKAIKECQRIEIVDRNREFQLNWMKEEKSKEILDRIKSGVLGDILVNLNKKLRKKIEENQIMNEMWKVLDERRIREAKESGRRQIEERRREQCEIIFNQQNKMNQIFIESFLAENLEKAKDKTSTKISCEILEDFSKIVDTEAVTLDNTKPDGLTAHELSSALAHQFIIPHVNQITLEEEKKAERMKNLKVIRSELFLELEKQEF